MPAQYWCLLALVLTLGGNSSTIHLQLGCLEHRPLEASAGLVEHRRLVAELRDEVGKLSSLPVVGGLPSLAEMAASIAGSLAMDRILHSCWLADDLPRCQ